MGKESEEKEKQRDVSSCLPEEGREGEEKKPGTDIVNSKLEELVGKTAMKVADEERRER